MILALLLSSILNDAVPIVTVNLLDYSSTKYGLTKETHEINPLIGPGGQRLLLVKSISTAGSILLIRELRKKNPKAAKVLKYSAIVIGSGVSIHNIIQTRRRLR